MEEYHNLLWTLNNFWEKPNKDENSLLIRKDMLSMGFEPGQSINLVKPVPTILCAGIIVYYSNYNEKIIYLPTNKHLKEANNDED
jgi:hypothetical protein